MTERWKVSNYTADGVHEVEVIPGLNMSSDDTAPPKSIAVIIATSPIRISGTDPDHELSLYLVFSPNQATAFAQQMLQLAQKLAEIESPTDLAQPSDDDQP